MHKITNNSKRQKIMATKEETTGMEGSVRGRVKRPIPHPQHHRPPQKLRTATTPTTAITFSNSSSRWPMNMGIGMGTAMVEAISAEEEEWGTQKLRLF